MLKTKESESLCELRYRTQGPYWHVWSKENHPIIFTCADDFRAAMSIMGIVAVLCPKVRIITFEWMSNHVHIVVAGEEKSVVEFLDTLKEQLQSYLDGGRHGWKSYDEKKSKVDLTEFSLSFRELTSLSEVRNVIAYDNRNGYLVSPDETPFSYPWGANRYYFNPDAKLVFEQSGRRMTVMEKRRLIHSHMADMIRPLKMVYGCVCPMDFCNITEGEELFAGASQYFHSISKSVESYKSIAEELSENIFITDEEMYSVACAIASNKYHSRLADLDNVARTETAKTLHFDYKAGNKQIARILKMPLSLIETLFP